MRSTLIPAVAIGLIVFSSVAQSPSQTQFVYTTNLFPVADATIRSDAPDSNFGSDSFVMAGTSNSGAMVSRGLFRFDLSGIPTYATVSNAMLSFVSVNQAANDFFALSRLLTNWNESEVTWNRRTASMLWTAPGCQSSTDFFEYLSSYFYFQAVPGLTNQVTDNGPFPDAGLVYDTQLWINNPAQNFGWIWQDFNESTGTNLVEVGSRENPGNQPVLTVSYTLTFTPPVLTVVPSTNGEFCISFNIEPNHGYGVQSIDDLQGTNWTTVLVLDPPPEPQDFLFCFPMTTSNRFYRIHY